MTEKNTSIRTKTRHPADFLTYIAIYVCAIISVALLLGIIIYVFAKGIRSVNWEFLTSVTSVLKGTTGIAGNIVNTLYIIIVTMLIATPIGVGAAVYLNEYAKPGKLVSLIEFATETLAGIPSIIFGLFGMMFFGTGLGLGYSILTGSLTLTLMVLPLITRNTQEALKTVPDSYRSGALGMGATKWYMIRTILLPSAAPGILTGVILSIGRIVGESAALLFTAGMGMSLNNFFGSVGNFIHSSGASLTVALYVYARERAEFDVAFAIAAILIVLALLINLAASLVSRYFRRKNAL